MNAELHGGWRNVRAVGRAVTSCDDQTVVRRRTTKRNHNRVIAPTILYSWHPGDCCMPMYEFYCRTCAHEFEALVRAQDPPATCPACHGQDVERQLSTFAVSSAEKTAAAARDSRKRQVKANKDKIIADEEYRKKHEGH